jgi:hypothetical protein
MYILVKVSIFMFCKRDVFDEMSILVHSFWFLSLRREADNCRICWYAAIANMDFQLSGKFAFENLAFPSFLVLKRWAI